MKSVVLKLNYYELKSYNQNLKNHDLNQIMI